MLQYSYSVAILMSVAPVYFWLIIVVVVRIKSFVNDLTLNSSSQNAACLSKKLQNCFYSSVEEVKSNMIVDEFHPSNTHAGLGTRGRPTWRLIVTDSYLATELSLCFWRDFVTFCTFVF